jgi:hypothetical protein
MIAQVNKQRRLGVEYEMVFCSHGNSGSNVQNSLAQVLTTNGLPAIARGYSHTTLPVGTDLAVEYDSSVRGQFEWQGVPCAAIELKTRILNGLDEWNAIVPKALNICTDLGATVNYSCGHHLHLAFDEADQKPKHLRSLVNLVYRFEPIIYGLVSPSRITCGYAQPLTAEKVQRFQNCRNLSDYRAALNNYERRMGLNLTNCLQGSGSHLEIRYHQGTLSPEKSRSWLIFWLQMLEHAIRRDCRTSQEQLTNSRIGIEKLRIATGFRPNNGIYQQVDEELLATGEYLLKRWKHFNGKISLKKEKTIKREKEEPDFPPREWA